MSNKTTVNLKTNHIICKCGKDLGEVKDSKGYLCAKCNIVYFTSENSLNELEKMKIKQNKNVLDFFLNDKEKEDKIKDEDCLNCGKEVVNEKFKILKDSFCSFECLKKYYEEFRILFKKKYYEEFLGDV